MMEASFDIYGLPLQICSGNRSLLRMFTDELKMFQEDGKGHVRGALRLNLNTRSERKNGNFHPAPIEKHETMMSNKFLAPDTLLTNYGKSLVTVIARRSERTIDAFVAADYAASTDPVYHRCFSQPVSLWLKEKGLYFVHAACVSDAGRGILIVGNSRAGKSTLSVSAVRSGFKFLGDEQPILSIQAGRLQVFAFPRRIRLDTEAAKLFPELSCLRKPSENRFVFRAEKVWPGCAISSCEPKVLVFPRFHLKGKMSKKRLHPSAALARLLGDDYLVLYQARSWRNLFRKHLALFERLVQHTVAFELAYGTDDILEIPNVFRELLSI